jgi:hypothetical protein
VVSTGYTVSTVSHQFPSDLRCMHAELAVSCALYARARVNIIAPCSRLKSIVTKWRTGDLGPRTETAGPITTNRARSCAELLIHACPRKPANIGTYLFYWRRFGGFCWVQTVSNQLRIFSCGLDSSLRRCRPKPSIRCGAGWADGLPSLKPNHAQKYPRLKVLKSYDSKEERLQILIYNYTMGKFIFPLRMFYPL